MTDGHAAITGRVWSALSCQNLTEKLYNYNLSSSNTYVTELKRCRTWLVAFAVSCTFWQESLCFSESSNQYGLHVERRETGMCDK